MTYGLPECKLIAAKAVMPRHIDFFKPEEIVKAAQEHPASAHVVGLISAQILRAKIVADVIFGYEAEDFLPKTYVKVRDGQKSEFIDDSGGGMMMCDRCIPRLDIWDMKRPVSYIPSWLYGWSRYAYEELRAKPLDQATDIFKPQCLISFPPENMDVCEDCVKTAAEARTWDDGQPGEVFRDWASGVRNLLEKRLGVLDCLYSL
ncbi:hypothetical protein FRC09_001328 [Ceratobasidium sp. 395]|nr:hypothetical protein FRC09_001328 [Ceratobasidium sp. 395]